jgi:predicted transcriptional regulator YdeE
VALLRGILTGFFAHSIEGTQPRIVELDQPITILGMLTETDTKRVYRAVSLLGKRFERYKRENEIPNTVHPWAFAAVSKDFDEKTGTFTYIMGDVVTRVNETPPGLTAFEITVGTYAVFPVRPKNRFGWGLAIANVKRYAYTIWLPNSGYELAGTIDDFEYHDGRSTRKNDPEIDLYVAIRLLKNRRGK